MDAARQLQLALDPSQILTAQGMQPDPWQRDLLLSVHPRILLCCTRGAGKSRTTSALALHTALFQPKALVLLVSRAQRQALELYRYVRQGWRALGNPMGSLKETETQLELSNGSRIVAVPGKESNIRSYQGVNLLVIDEAARVPDDLIKAVTPMTATAQGRIILLTTPFGQRGFFWQEWEDTRADWARWKIPWWKCPRISRDFIDEEERRFGRMWIEQEYECSFTSMEGLVYPSFADCIAPQPLPKDLYGRKVGGIDWGFRNPFAALWGTLDRDDVLWIQGERYQRETALHSHVTALQTHRRSTLWWADPAGRTEIEELRHAGFAVRRGLNDLRAGIQAVTARLQTGRLKVAPSCTNLIAEAKLYHREKDSENPVDEYNHALGALRYLICGLDKRYLAKIRRTGTNVPEATPAPPTPAKNHAPDLNDPNLWTTL